MKNLFIVLTAVVLGLTAGAQTTPSTPSTVDYYRGRWDILCKGTPQGDAKMIFKLDKVSDTLSGSVMDSTGAEISKMYKIEQKDAQLTVYFIAQGYDVNVVLNKKDDDHVTGSLLSMFDVTGERIKER